MCIRDRYLTGRKQSWTCQIAVQYKYHQQFWAGRRLKKSSHNVTLPVCRSIRTTHTLHHTHQDVWRNSGASQTTTRRDWGHSISIIIIIIKFSGFRTNTNTHTHATVTADVRRWWINNYIFVVKRTLKKKRIYLWTVKN